MSSARVALHRSRLLGLALRNAVSCQGSTAALRSVVWSLVVSCGLSSSRCLVVSSSHRLIVSCHAIHVVSCPLLILCLVSWCLSLFPSSHCVFSPFISSPLVSCRFLSPPLMSHHIMSVFLCRVASCCVVSSPSSPLLSYLLSALISSCLLSRLSLMV